MHTHALNVRRFDARSGGINGSLDNRGFDAKGVGRFQANALDTRLLKATGHEQYEQR